MIINSSSQEGKISLKQTLLSVGVLIIVLCAGISWGSVINYSPMPECTVNKSADTAIQQGAAQEETDAGYKTFSEEDVYFTFEYPSDWVYDKHSPTDPYDETYYTFYKNADKKEVALSLNYPMYETAMDTCVKFEETTDYTHEHIATDDPGTYINYMTCGGGTESESNDIFWGEDSMGDIFWQKGVWDGDKGITSDEKTQARIHWNGDSETNIVTKDISDHIAHSIKIIK